MTAIYWSLVNWLSRFLEPNERDAVLGDLAESEKASGEALRDVLGLVVRRQAALWGAPLLRSIVAILVGMALSFYFADTIFGYLARPLTDALHALGLSSRLVYTHPFDPFIVYLKLSTMCGLFLGSPYVVWQIWASVSPDLYRHENRYLWPFVTLASTLFLTGGFFAYKVAFPAALWFTVSYGTRLRPVITIHDYWNLAISILLGIGLVFELPALWWLLYLKKKARRSSIRDY